MPARTSDSELNHYAKRSESFESHLKNFHAKRANDIAARQREILPIVFKLGKKYFAVIKILPIFVPTKPAPRGRAGHITYGTRGCRAICRAPASKGRFHGRYLRYSNLANLNLSEGHATERPRRVYYIFMSASPSGLLRISV